MPLPHVSFARYAVEGGKQISHTFNISTLVAGRALAFVFFFLFFSSFSKLDREQKLLPSNEHRSLLMSQALLELLTFRMLPRLLQQYTPSKASILVC